MSTVTRDQVFEALKFVQDPEIHIGIVDLGLVYDAEISETNEVKVKMTLTTPACPYGPMLMNMAQQAAEGVDGVTKAEIILVWEPVWDPREMASDMAKDQLGIW